MKIAKKSKVSKVVPAATVTPEAAPKAAKTASVAVSKYKGATTGLRVMEYQDTTFAANIKKMLTDEELVADWRREFPNAVAFTVAHVGGARRDYNNGRHSKAFARPEIATDQYVIVDGRRVGASTIVAAPKAKAAKAPAAPVAPAAPAPKAKAAKTAAPKASAVRLRKAS